MPTGKASQEQAADPMDRRRHNAPLRFYRGKEGGFFHAGAIPPQLVEGCVRIRGYLFNAFAQGADYIIWNKHAFAKKSKDARHPRFAGQGYTVEYVEKLMRTFRKTTTEFKIEEIRLGRSPRLKITMLGRAAGNRIDQVRGRLLGYIRGSVKIHGWVKVDAAFVSHFINTTGAPAEIVASVWQALKFVPGCRAYWKGCGANLKFVVCGVSLQQSSLPHSSPSGRRYESKTVPPAASGGQDRFSTAAPSAAEGGRPTTGAGHAHPSAKRSAWPQRSTADPNPRQALEGTAAIGDFTATRQHDPLREPFEAGGRWISGAKILKLAGWIAVEPLQAAHEKNLKVRWRFAHARNFAARALRAGHRVPAIVAAYRAGLQRSHDDASMAGETVRDHAPREPSAAVNYAWRELFKDARSRDDRWREIIGGERAPKPARVRVSRAAVEEKTSVPDSLPPRDREKFVTLKTILTPQEFRAVDLGGGGDQLLALLRSRGITLQQFQTMPYTARIRLAQSAIKQGLPPPENNISK